MGINPRGIGGIWRSQHQGFLSAQDNRVQNIVPNHKCQRKENDDELEIQWTLGESGDIGFQKGGQDEDGHESNQDLDAILRCPLQRLDSFEGAGKQKNYSPA